MGARKRGWVGKVPFETHSGAWKDWAAAFWMIVLTNTNYITKRLAGFEYIKNALRAFVRNVDVDLAHGFHRERVQCTRLQPCAMGFKKITCDVVQPGFGHLA